ncbi:MAG: tetratricopeptide repeat protein [Limisphaerales bacterium]
MRGSFVWDDDAWTLNLIKRFPTLSGLGQMWLSPTTQEHQFYPLTATSFWIDYHVWGFWTPAYHVENVLLHLLSVLLFWKILSHLNVPGAGLAAGIFALHPMMVESVAWIAERKNVLSLTLFLGALLSFGRFTRFWSNGGDSPGEERPRRDWRPYVAALLLFLGAYLAKATVFAFPAVLLLICWWKRGHLRWSADVLPTAPFFALTLALGLVTSWLEKNPLGAKGPEFDALLSTRCLIAGRALWFYVGKLLWPSYLCFNYPRWQMDARSVEQWLWPITAVVALLLLWLFRKRLGRGPFAAALYFIATAFPLLGFMSAYYIRYSYVADHWVYLPSLGLLALFAGAVSSTVVAQRFSRKAYLACSGALLLVLGTLTWNQTGIYKDDEALWRDTAAKNPGSWMAWNFLGAYAEGKGALEQALQYYRRSIEVYPSFEACYNLGKALLFAGHTDEGIAAFRRSIQLRPDVSVVHQDLGIALASQGFLEEAMAEYRKAIQFGPARAYPYFCLGTALERLGRTKEAIIQYREAARLNPRMPEALRNLAAIMASDASPELRDGVEAVHLAERACRLTGYQESLSVSILAMAYAEVGRWEDAVAMARKATSLATTAGDKESAEHYRKLAEQFQSRQPYHGER